LGAGGMVVSFAAIGLGEGGVRTFIMPSCPPLHCCGFPTDVFGRSSARSADDRSIQRRAARGRRLQNRQCQSPTTRSRKWQSLEKHGDCCAKLPPTSASLETNCCGCTPEY